jgi:hypothetical protein
MSCSLFAVRCLLFAVCCLLLARRVLAFGPSKWYARYALVVAVAHRRLDTARRKGSLRGRLDIVSPDLPKIKMLSACLFVRFRSVKMRLLKMTTVPSNSASPRRRSLRSVSLSLSVMYFS